MGDMAGTMTMFSFWREGGTRALRLDPTGEGREEATKELCKEWLKGRRLVVTLGGEWAHDAFLRPASKEEIAQVEEWLHGRTI